MKLFQSGELKKRVAGLKRRLESCDICPHACGVDRRAGERGTCGGGLKVSVASVCDHHGEEPALSGARGSGTIFFENCNMACVYCQNHQISQPGPMQPAHEAGAETLAGHMLLLQKTLNCHNINLVTPSHYVPQILEAVNLAAAQGLRLPLVYNTSSYDSVATLRALNGVVDIYLADMRYADDAMGLRYSGVPDYAARARQAIGEMFRQVGLLQITADGTAVRGLIIRHLVLPQGISGSRECLTWLCDELSPRVAVSVMSQYYPAHRAAAFPEINRPVTRDEYNEVLQVVEELGLENGWLQAREAESVYRPDFARAERPFEGVGNRVE